MGGTNTRVAVGTPDGEYVIVAKFLARTVAQLTAGLDKLVGMFFSSKKMIIIIVTIFYLIFLLSL